jgi:NAD(P)-dependent dehydrogenase (short-subunit alcohol dehydrogenase family)
LRPSTFIGWPHCSGTGNLTCKYTSNFQTPGALAERGQAEEFARHYCQKTPLAKMATEKDVFASTVFLLSDASRQITGQNIVVDGGLSVQ